VQGDRDSDDYTVGDRAQNAILANGIARQNQPRVAGAEGSPHSFVCCGNGWAGL
jgi:hypothetical protein